MSFNTSNTALLVVDVQRGLFRKPTTIYNQETLLNNIEKLVAEAHETKIQVIHIQHYNKVLHGLGSAIGKLHPRIKLEDGDIIIHKEQTSAFKNTSLQEELEKRKIEKIVVMGLITQGCIKSTCLDGKKLGFDVVLVEDGHSNYNQNAEEVITQWNESLKKENIAVLKTEDIDFI